MLDWAGIGGAAPPLLAGARGTAGVWSVVLAVSLLGSCEGCEDLDTEHDSVPHPGPSPHLLSGLVGEGVSNHAET